MQRQTILNALYTLVSASAGYVTTGRRLRHWDECPAQPAIFQRYLGEERMPLTHGYGIPQETVMKVDLFIYVQNGGPDSSPDTIVTPLLDALDVAFASNATYDGRQTLGLEGYVTHAWIEGETNVSLGESADQAICIVPVRIAVNATMGPP